MKITNIHEFGRNTDSCSTETCRKQIQSLCVCICMLAVLLLYEGVGNGLHAILRTDEDNSRPSTHDEAELPGVLRQFILIIRVCTGGKTHTSPLNPNDANRFILLFYLKKRHWCKIHFLIILWMQHNVCFHNEWSYLYWWYLIIDFQKPALQPLL